MEQQPESPSSISYITAHKKLLILLGLFAVFILLLAVVFFPAPFNSQDEKNQNKQANSQETENPNPYVSNNDIKKVAEGAKQQYKKAGKKLPEQKDYHFQYKVAPGFLENKTTGLFIRKAYAVDTCNLATAPSSVPAYLLKAHYTTDEATDLSKSYGLLDAQASSVPGTSDTTYQYYFSEPSTSQFFKLSEPSGTYEYHSAVVSTDANGVSQNQAEDIAQKLLAEHGLADHLVSIDKGLDSSLFGGNNEFSFTYQKKFDYQVVDTLSLQDLGKVKSVCDAGPADGMNYVQVMVDPKGDLAKLVNQTRKIDSMYMVTRESLENSIKEYSESLPIPPVLIGVPESTDATVTIDQAALVYYDYGDVYAQYGYIPSYVTSGTTANGSRVMNIFPAVSTAELDKTPLSPTQKNHDNLQLSTFNPAPPPPKGGKLCFGNMVDYRVKCTIGTSSQQACSGLVSLPAGQNDPFGVCGSGCQQKSDVIDVAAGENACSKFMEKYGLPGDKLISPGNKANGKTPAPSDAGSYSCSIQGCPC